MLAAVLNLWSLTRNAWANEYYSAAVRSMTQSWHSFFFGSFDASGVMTVDKPPLAVWVQALSARIFGFHPLSLLVPQALMGVAAVALVYDLTRRVFGRAAGFVAGAVLALTPITVAMSRHNNPDALLVLCCVGALWMAVRAFEDGRTRWIVLAGLLVGLGFETKMAVAFVVVPGIAAAWFFFGPNDRLHAFRQLLAGGATMAVTALAWPVAVWLTPGSDRPWISGTTDNSIWSLIFGYNGLGRLGGQTGGAGAGGPGSAAGLFGGATGPFRLLNAALGGQAGWLLGFAVVAIGAIAFVSRMRGRDRRTGWLVAVGGAFAVTAVAFSLAKGIFHPYYVSLLAPFSAALVGAGVGVILRGERGVQVFAPLAVIAGVATELAVLKVNPGQLTWLRPVLVVLAAAAVFVLANAGTYRVRSAAIATALAVLMLAPASWAIQTLGHRADGTFPAGGPGSTSPRGAQRGGPTGPAARFGDTTPAISAALAYAKQHGGGAVAVSSQSGAARSIIDSNADIVGIGGFSGRESQVSMTWFADQVRNGTIRWVVAASTGPGLPNDSRVGAKAVMAAVTKTCAPAKSRAGTIYDCKGRAAALKTLT